MGEDNGTQRRSRWDRYRLSLPRLPRRLTFRDVQIIIVGLILSVIGGAIGWLIGQTR